MLHHLLVYTLALFTSLVALRAIRSNPDGLAAKVLAGLTFCGVLTWSWSISEPEVTFSDFSVAYYPAGRAIIDDIPHLFVRCWDTPVCGFVNIPIVALLFTPFSMLTLRHAQWLFVIISVGSLVLSLWLLWSISETAAWRKWLIVLLFMANGPLVYSVKEGNLTHIALLLLIAGVVALENSWERSAGICFALAAIIKLPLLLFAVYFVGVRRWRVVIGYGLALVSVTAMSLWYAGWASHVEWYREVIQPLSGQGLAAFNVQSIEGLLLRFQDGARLYDWKPVPAPIGIRMAGQAAAVLLVGLSCIVSLRKPIGRRRDAMYLELSMVLCLSLLISPISWTHYYLFLLLPLSLYAGNRLPIPDHGGWVAALASCALLISAPVIYAGEEAANGWGGKLVVSHYVLGGLLLWGLTAYSRWTIGAARPLRLVATAGTRQRTAPGQPDEDSDAPHKRLA